MNFKPQISVKRILLLIINKSPISDILNFADDTRLNWRVAKIREILLLSCCELLLRFYNLVEKISKTSFISKRKSICFGQVSSNDKQFRAGYESKKHNYSTHNKLFYRIFRILWSNI